MKDNFQHMQQRTQRYWYQDGLGEIVVGLLFLLLGAYFWLQASLPADNPVAILLTSGFVLVLIGGIFAARRAIQALKTRLVYPRTGYVGYRQPQGRRRWLTALLAFMMAMLVSALFASAPASLAWIPAVTGLLVGVFWLVTAARIGLLRIYLLAGLSAIAGSGISLSGIGEHPGLALYYALMGLAMLVSGSLVLWQYLQMSQSYQEDGNDG